MNGAGLPVIKDLVLIGGGHAHVTVLKRFGMNPVPGVQLTLISPDTHTPYSGMLPGLIAGHYTYDEAHIDLMPLCRFAGARFIRGAIDNVDPAGKLVHLPGRPPIAYDVLSINAGSTPDPELVPGAAGLVIPVKPVAEFLEHWRALKARVLETPSCRIGIIGAGAGGVELALSAQFAIRTALTAAGIKTEPKFHIVTRGDDILETHNPRVKAAFQDVLATRGIELQTQFAVSQVDGRGVYAGSDLLELDEILWVTGANAPSWTEASGFDCDSRGFLLVNPSLQSISHSDVYGAGDIAAVVNHPRPKSGVFAVRQGPPLEANLRRAVLGDDPKPFRPQSSFLSLISTGGKHAVASRGSWCLSGDWIWRWKDHIDRSFMDKFNTLPEMGPPDPNLPPVKLPAALMTPSIERQLGETDMRCGGCGAKVGAGTLSNVLGGLNVITREGVVAGLDSPDDAAIIAPPQGKQLVQTVDYFRAMIDDPFVFGQITANHCLGDIYAMNGEPHSAMAIVTMPAGLPGKTANLLTQVMAGANDSLVRANCALIGGHTGEGSELSLGLAVTGLIDEGRALRKGGIQAGNVLILTKPLGTGTLFAAEMRGKAKGRWVQGAIETALLSNRAAAEVLGRHGATACTDVTGFGLAGHLHEMLSASSIEATIELDALPALEGAQETLAAGIMSSLQTENLQTESAIENADNFRSQPLYPLLFDPQTAGGLLASIPAHTAEVCILDLHRAGYSDAGIIGEAREPSLGVSGTVMLR